MTIISFQTSLNILEQENRHLTENLKIKDGVIDDLNNRQSQLDQELGSRNDKIEKRTNEVKNVGRELLKVFF